MPRQNWKFDLETKQHAHQQIKLILDALYDTPSMQDKIPVYLMKRVDALHDWACKYGWQALLEELEED